MSDVPGALVSLFTSLGSKNKDNLNCHFLGEK